MASRGAAATGVFTDAATWGLIETAGEIDSEQGTVVIGTSNVDSPTFTPSAAAGDAVYLKVSARAASPSGTMTVTYRNSTAGSDAQSVTFNVSDIHASGLGWICIKFGSTHTPNGTDSYIIRCVCSSAGSQVTLYRSTSGTNNFSKKIRLTTTGAPASGDHLVVTNEITGAGTGNTRTVTMDNTATTSFGPTVSGGPPQGIVVSGGGTLTWQTTSATNYYFKWKGIWWICGGGTVNVGTSGTPIPTNSSSVLEADASAATVDSGIRVDSGGVFNHYGPTKTLATLITADAAAAATSITVGDTTLWANSDVLRLAGTGATDSDYEERTVSSVGGATNVVLSSGLTNARTNVAVFPCEMINLTQPCKIRGVDSTHRIYIICIGTGQLILKQAEIFNIGSGTANKNGIDCQQTGAGLVTLERCSFHDLESNAFWFFLSGSTQGVNTTVKDCVGYNTGSVTRIDTNVATSVTIDGVWSIRVNGPHYDFRKIFNSFKNNRIVHQTSNTSSALIFRISGGSTLEGWGEANEDNWAGNSFHSINGSAVQFTELNGLNFGNPWVVYHNFWFKNWFFYICEKPTAAITFRVDRGHYFNFNFKGCNFYGNDSGVGTGTNQVYTTTSSFRFYNCKFNSGATRSTLTQTNGVRLDTHASDWYFENCDWSTVSTGLAVCTNDINCAWVGTITFTLSNCKLGGTNQVVNLNSGTPNLDPYSFVKVNRIGQTTGAHKSWFRYGTISSDTTIFNDASPSVRIAPVSSSVKIDKFHGLFEVPSGMALTVSINIRKSATGSGDAASYNGNQPRVVVRRNSEAGISADTVLGTMTASGGSWEAVGGVSATVADHCVLEVFVDCDGTAGWINLDDWLFSVA